MMDKLPKDWEWKKLGEVVEILDNKRIPINSNERENRIKGKSIKELYPYYGATQQNGWIDGYLFDEELVLLGEDGVPFLDRDKHKAYLIDGKSWVNNHAHVLKAKKGISLNRFIVYYLNIADYNNFVSGSTRLKLNQSLMKLIPFPLPPLPEQKQIVSVLDTTFEKLDQAITLVEENIQKLKQLNESVLNEVFGKLDKEENKFRLVDIADVKRGKSKHRPRNDKSLYGGSYPLIQTGDIRNAEKFITKFSQTYNEKGLEQSKLWKKGTICLTIAANIGDVAILGIDACFPDSVVGIYSKEYNNTYIFYFLKSIQRKLDEKSSASAQKNLSVEKLSDFYIPLPDTDKQQRIVAYLDQATEKNQKLIKHYQNKLEALKRVKNSILDSAFKGELRKEKVVVKQPNINFYYMQLIGASIQANRTHNIAQGEMAIAKDMYLLDRLYDVPTQMNFVNHSWGPFAPVIKKVINNNTYFGRKKFPNSNATYVDILNEETLLKTISSRLKMQIIDGINTLNQQLFSKVSPYKRAETKELLATVLKCIEDTQSIELTAIRQAMQNWKIEQGKFKTKAEKFPEKDTTLMIKFIIKENWHLKVLK